MQYCTGEGSGLLVPFLSGRWGHRGLGCTKARLGQAYVHNNIFTERLTIRGEEKKEQESLLRECGALPSAVSLLVCGASGQLVATEGQAVQHWTAVPAKCATRGQRATVRRC